MVITFGELRDLERRLRNRKVLSVFVDTSAIASAKRFGWREGLNRALARLQVTPPQLSTGERIARELSMAHLRTLLEGMGALPDEPGWVAYATTDDVVAAGPVRARLETTAFWEDGIVVAPLLPTVTKSRAVPLADLVSAETVQRLGEDSRATRPALRPPRGDSAPVTASLAASG